jgi:hypothetical protein
MSYVDRGGIGTHFKSLALLGAATVVVDGEIDIGASSGDHGELLCFKQCKLVRCAFMLTSEAASGTSVAPTVIFTKRPTPLSATSEAVACTLTIPSGTAVGKVVYKDIASPVSFAPGDSLEISWTIGTGTPTGIGMWYIEVIDDPETAANQSDMIASA